MTITKTNPALRPALSILGAAVLTACGGGGGGGGGNAPVAGNPPTVSTTRQIIVSAGDAVTLSASATDPDGDTISYRWTQNSGATVANSSGFNTADASFTANSDVDTLEFSVTASAGGQSDTEVVYVIIVEDVNTAVFVDADAGGTPDGSIDNPFTDLRAAMESATDEADFYVRTPASGARYRINADGVQRTVLTHGQSVYGAYGADWVRDVELNKTPIDSVGIGLYHFFGNAPTVISGLDLDIEATEVGVSSATLYGILSVGNTESYIVEDSSIVVESADARMNTSSFALASGIYVTRTTTAAVRNTTIVVGDAGDTQDRGSRVTGVGRDGLPGVDARVGDNQTGGAPGASTGGGWNGGRGGDAGTTSFEPGDGGSRGSGRSSPVVVRGGSGGALGADSLGSRNAGDGANGDDGPRGPSGDGGNGRGDINQGGEFAKSVGGLGSDGWAGGGGGGGGGGGAGAAGVNGGAGGGGGEGGDGGEGGFGGLQGNPSIGIHFGQVTTSEIVNNTITTGSGGTGGRGGLGAAGGDGGAGGAGVAGTNGLGDNDGGRGGDGGSGGTGGTGGFGGSGGGGPSYGIFFGTGSGGDVRGNTITTGDGGTGGAARVQADVSSAGQGGWSVGIFDADTNDGIAITQSNNTFTIGAPGADGAPSTGTGVAMPTNLP
ncbi:MAG: hypothetical protein AAF578_09960 [Pseudomonadota bacterium]